MTPSSAFYDIVMNNHSLLRAALISFYYLRSTPTAALVFQLCFHSLPPALSMFRVNPDTVLPLTKPMYSESKVDLLYGDPQE